MTINTELKEQLAAKFADDILELNLLRDELTLELRREVLLSVCKQLRNDFQFEQCIDVCGVDYLHYGLSEWQTHSATSSGFERAREMQHDVGTTWDKPRFAVVYHLLSIEKNYRLRLRIFLEEQDLQIDSVVSVWASANWYEREVFDMFGIVFDGHPDLRRILSDYGFVGHPFRKDFPLIGQVQVRYDEKEQRVIYEPVDIQPRILVPKTIREDHRYAVDPLPPKSEHA